MLQAWQILGIRLQEDEQMKKNGYDYDECCYEEMTRGIGGQSQPSECWHEPLRNNYEMTRKNYNANGLDQSAMEAHRK